KAGCEGWRAAAAKCRSAARGYARTRRVRRDEVSGSASDSRSVWDRDAGIFGSENRRSEMIEWTKIEKAPRILLVAELVPALGDRFQPTGFADLGAAQYTRPDKKEMLLVESAQSVANRLEKTCLDGDGP